MTPVSQEIVEGLLERYLTLPAELVAQPGGISKDNWCIDGTVARRVADDVDRDARPTAE